MEREGDFDLEERREGVQTETPEGEIENRGYAGEEKDFLPGNRVAETWSRRQKRLKKRVYRIRALYLALFTFHNLCIFRILSCRLCFSCKFP